MHPKMMRQDELLVAGLTGDGRATGELWERFGKLYDEIGIRNKLSENSYEIRIYDGSECTCHVGVSVSDNNVDGAFALMKLPASSYAVFEVLVARGYDSANAAMDEWLETNRDKYRQRLIDGKPYAVEFYGERFKGDSEDSIVEIWVPIEEMK